MTLPALDETLLSKYLSDIGKEYVNYIPQPSSNTAIVVYFNEDESGGNIVISLFWDKETVMNEIYNILSDYEKRMLKIKSIL